jgi:hypothetical protein
LFPLNFENRAYISASEIFDLPTTVVTYIKTSVYVFENHGYQPWCGYWKLHYNPPGIRTVLRVDNHDFPINQVPRTDIEPRTKPLVLSWVLMVLEGFWTTRTGGSLTRVLNTHRGRLLQIKELYLTPCWLVTCKNLFQLQSQMRTCFKLCLMCLETRTKFLGVVAWELSCWGMICRFLFLQFLVTS